MDLSDAYANGPYIAQAEDYPPRWTQAASCYRKALALKGRLREGLAYGPGPRERFDLFLPEGSAKGLLVFVHGGYWMAFGRETWSHLAGGAVARGWAVALPSYDLCPAVRLSGITRQIAAAVTAAAREVDGRSGWPGTLRAGTWWRGCWRRRCCPRRSRRGSIMSCRSRRWRTCGR